MIFFLITFMLYAFDVSSAELNFSGRLRQIKGLFDPDPKYPRPAPGGFL